MLVLIDLFKSELRTLTAIRSSVLTAGDSDDKNTLENVNISLVFETLEVLLLYSGPTVTVSMREEIEICVGHGKFSFRLLFAIISLRSVFIIFNVSVFHLYSIFNYLY